ncbi:MAG: hypothetical protein ACRC2T_16155, partial [Thermoguttaceae bacterium]
MSLLTAFKQNVLSEKHTKKVCALFFIIRQTLSTSISAYFCFTLYVIIASLGFSVDKLTAADSGSEQPVSHTIKVGFQAEEVDGKITFKDYQNQIFSLNLTQKNITQQTEMQVSPLGIIEMQTDKVIGYLSSYYISGKPTPNPRYDEVRLYSTNPEDGTKTGGRTLTIAGNEIDALTGQKHTKAAYDGIIKTDGNAASKEKIIKYGTSVLTLAGNNSNSGDEFEIEIKEGTIKVENANALGGGNITVSTTDTMRDALIIGEGAFATGKFSLKNNVALTSGSKFQIGIDSTAAKSVYLDGKVTGNGYVVMDFSTVDQTLHLTNHTGNDYNETILKKGTLVVAGTLAGSIWKTGLGSGAIISDTDSQAGLQIDTDNLVLANDITTNSSNFVISTTQNAHTISLNGNISGTGGLQINLKNSTDNLSLNGKLLYKGNTTIRNGKVFLGGTNTTQNFSGAVSICSTGTLDMNGKTITFDSASDSSITGSIIDSSVNKTGAIVKNGTGILTLDAKNTIEKLTVNSGAVNLNGTNVTMNSAGATYAGTGQKVTVNNLKLTGSSTLNVKGDSYVTYLETDTATSTISVDKTATLTLDSNAQTFSGKLKGNGTIAINAYTGAGENISYDWNLKGNNIDTWSGTLDVKDGATLQANSYGALGNFNSVNNKGEAIDVATVILNDKSTLSLSSYVIGLGKLKLAANGTGTVNTGAGVYFTVFDISGSGGMIKDGAGSMYLKGENKDFSGNLTFLNGKIILDDV